MFYIFIVFYLLQHKFKVSIKKLITLVMFRVQEMHEKINLKKLKSVDGKKVTC